MSQLVKSKRYDSPRYKSFHTSDFFKPWFDYSLQFREGLNWTGNIACASFNSKYRSVLLKNKNTFAQKIQLSKIIHTGLTDTYK